MAGSSGFAVSIKAVDQTAGPLDAINKRLARLAAPAERFNKALSKFGDVSGISRVAEGVRGLGAGAADAFRSLDRMASPLASITSVGSLAGIAALSRRWAEFGNTIGQTSYRLNMPVEKLGALRGAMRLAGGNAADVDTGLLGLNKTLNAAAWGTDSGAVSLFQQLKIATRDANGNVRDTVDVLGDVLEKIHGMPAATQALILNQTGLGEGFLVLAKNGRKGLEDLQRQAERTGGAMTHEMVENATAMEKAWQHLGLTAEGVWNRMVDRWSGTITAILESSAHWIESNPDLMDSIAKVGTAVSVAVGSLSALKVAPWILRAMGWMLPGEAATVAPLAAPLLLSGDTAQPDDGRAEAWKNGPEAWKAWKEKHPGVTTWLYELGAGTPGGGAQSDSTGSGSSAPKTTPADPRHQGTAPDPAPGQVRDWWQRHAPTWAGGDTPGAAAVRAGAASPAADLLGDLGNSRLGKLLARGEAGAADYNAVNRGAAGGYASGMENLVNMTVAEVQAAQKAHRFNAAGRYQIIGPTLDAAVATLGLTGREKFDAATQDRIFEQYLATSKRPEIGDYISGRSNDLHAALLAMSKEWASVADPDTGLSHYGGVGNNKASISAAEAAAALDQTRAHVLVEIVHKNAPQGTSVKVVSSGPVTAPPPRIETPLPMVH